jgi:hypothetical protein
MVATGFPHDSKRLGISEKALKIDRATGKYSATINFDVLKCRRPEMRNAPEIPPNFVIESVDADPLGLHKASYGFPYYVRHPT